MSSAGETFSARMPTPLVALVGNPNCGKTALFNLLTGSRQKIANYAGVTVERKEGNLVTASGRTVRILDLPGAYSLRPRTPDERITCEVLGGQASGEARPDAVVAVVDATNLRQNLRLVLALKRLNVRLIVALNMVDLARRRGLAISAQALGQGETGGLRAQHQLRQAMVVAQVDEHQPAVVALAMDPAGQTHIRASVA